jgi:hypothetical protein
MSKWRHAALAALFALAACGQQQQPAAEGGGEGASAVSEAPGAGDEETLPAGIGEVDPSLLAAPNEYFTAIEPSEVGVFAAPTVMESLSDLVGLGAHEGGGDVQLSIRESGDAATADIVRSSIPDDSVIGGHIRIEFRREPDGWFPTNAYRRVMCARGPVANQWTTEVCP